MGMGYNIFTHRVEKHFLAKNGSLFLFQFPVFEGKYTVYNREVESFDEEELKANLKFYKLVDSNYSYGDEYCIRTINSLMVLVDKSLSFYIRCKDDTSASFDTKIVEGNVFKRVPEISFLLKKGMSIELSLEYFNYL
jgi:hypothetical protein